MAVNVTGRKPMFGNRRSHAINATRHKQKLNLQVVTLEDGTKIRMTAREKRTLLKDSAPVDFSTEEVMETKDEVVEEKDETVEEVVEEAAPETDEAEETVEEENEEETKEEA